MQHTMLSEILFVPHNHFDPVWRRCFDRDAKAHGVVVRSYAELEALAIDRFLALRPRGYTFSEGQAAIWRKYLERHPRNLELLRQAARDGTLDVVLAGETVQDTNLPSAEGLIRNFLVALPLYEQLVGPDHAGLRLAWLEDAFGNSANYPQVLRGVGAEVACQISYCCCPDPVWVGIDGTKIPCYDSQPTICIGAFDKHPPCPKCRGRGCRTCRRTGMQLVPGFDPKPLSAALQQAASSRGKWACVFLLTEEILPDPALIDLIDGWNQDHPNNPAVRFANPSNKYACCRDDLDKALRAGDDTPTPELNPAMPGCMVSRIRCKQRTRSVAYQLLAAEAALATRAWRRRRPIVAPADFAQAWQQVAFNQFHDAITGTHIDSAHTELMEMLDRAAAAAVPHLKSARKSPAQQFAKVPDVGRKRLGNLTVEFDRIGIRTLLVGDRDLFGQLPGYTRNKRPSRIGELVLEADHGDAWGQRIAASESTCVALGDFNRTCQVSARSIRWRGAYTGGDPKVRRLRWTVTAAASPDGRRVDFVTEVDWDTHSRRLRVIVPVRASDPTATYEIPFGFIDRTFDSTKLDFSQLRSHTMEWPTLHWARKSIDGHSGVAILNKGLPCYRWMPGRFDLSLLRSPDYNFCVVEPAQYEFWDIDGQRDAGHHRFEYSIWPYTDAITYGDLTRTGYAYNLPQPIDPPFKIVGEVVVTAWKPAERGDGWILRLQEAGGTGTLVSIQFGRSVRATPTDLLERPRSGGRVTSTYRTKIHRHGLLTLHIAPA